MYQTCRSAIQTPFGLTDWFSSDLGTRQCSVLSLFLFSLLLSPLATFLRDKGFGVSIMGTKVACLLYADDLVLIAESETEMRAMMEEETQFFYQWRFTEDPDCLLWGRQSAYSPQPHLVPWQRDH
jgi:hypothetical protein